MTTILLGIVIFGICIFFLSIGLIFSKKTRLKKSCGSAGIQEHQLDGEGNPLPCATCTCQSRPSSERCAVVFNNNNEEE